MSKPHFIMLPGMMCDRRLFAPQIEALSDRFEITVPALTGHDTMQGLAASILKNAPDRFALLGLSMGGIVAMEIAKQAPERISHLALLDTNPNSETPETKAAREPQIENVKNGKLLEVMRDEMKPRYLYDGPRKSAILDLCMDMALDLGADAFISQSEALQSRPNYKDVLKTFDGPTLVLCGEHDALCPPERHELMHSLSPNSELVVVKEAGHLPTLEQPATTTSAIGKWLSNAQ